MSQVLPIETLQEWRETARYWKKYSATIRSMFAPLTNALIADSGIETGQLVLDVAGGTGEPSLTIAGKVGPTGSVMCTDAVEEMVVAAEHEAWKRGIENVEFRQCSADSLPFPDNAFDAVVSRLGAMFFPDPLAALREMLRVTKCNGTLALAVWHKSELNPFSYVVTRVVSRHIELEPENPDSLGAFRFAEPGKLADILTAAGAIEVSERILKFQIEAPISVKEFWAMRSEVSEILREKLKDLTDEESFRIAQEVEDSVREFFPQDRMSFPAQMIILKGKKPSSGNCSRWF
jgi:ubiquinone/menaquinone biosynthesis C-methylase UbiE